MPATLTSIVSLGASPATPFRLCTHFQKLTLSGYLGVPVKRHLRFIHRQLGRVACHPVHTLHRVWGIQGLGFWIGGLGVVV